VYLHYSSFLGGGYRHQRLVRQAMLGADWAEGVREDPGTKLLYEAAWIRGGREAVHDLRCLQSL